MDRLIRLRMGGAVRRFHTYPVIGNQSVAEHSFNVLLIVMHFIDPSPALMSAIIHHDLAEYDTGDIPSQVKWKHPDLDAILDKIEERIEQELDIHWNLDEQDRRWLELGDLLDLVLFAYEQRMLGNRYMDLVIQRVTPKLYEHPYYTGNVPGVRKFVDDLLLRYTDV